MSTSNFVQPEDYAPAGTVLGLGTTDDTQWVRDAINSGKPVCLPGKYYIKQGIHCSTPSQPIFGINRDQSMIFCGADFDMASLGLLIFDTSAGPDVRDLNLQFIQPDTSNYNSLIKFPPAIYTQGVFAWSLRRVRISAAWDGIDMRGNCGGVVIDDLQMAAFHKGVMIDGSLDTVDISHFHGFNYGTGGNFPLVNNVIWFDVGKVDDFKFSKILALTGQTFNFFPSNAFYSGPGVGIASGSIDQCDFDEPRLALNMTAGNVAINSGYMAVGSTVPAGGHVSCQGGTLSLEGVDFGFNNGAVNGDNAFFQVGNGGKLSIIGSLQISCQVDMPIARCLTNGQLVFSDNNIIQQYATSPLTRSKIICDAGGRLTALGNRVNDAVHASNFFNVVNDDFHQIHDNGMPGWTNILPAGFASRYANNGTYDAPYPVRFSPTDVWFMDAAGNGTVAVPQGGTAAFPSGAGFVMILDAVTGSMALLAFSIGGIAVIYGNNTVIQGNTGSTNNSGRNDGIANTGKIGFYYSGALYRLINNTGAAISLTVIDFRMKATA